MCVGVAAGNRQGSMIAFLAQQPLNQLGSKRRNKKVYNRSNGAVVYKFSPPLDSRKLRIFFFGFVLTLFPRTRVAYFENFCNIESERILQKVLFIYLFIYLEEKKHFSAEWQVSRKEPK